MSSRGVLADVSAGGLKKDLTAGLLGSTPPTSIINSTPLFAIPASGAPTTTPAALPSWGALRSYVQLQNSLSGATPSIAPRATTDTQMGIYPVLARTQLWIHATAEADASKSLRLLYFPAVVLWNPYDVTLQATTYTGQFYNSSSFYAKILAEMGPAAGAATSYKWGTDRLRSSFLTKGFIINCPPIAPGEAIVFTPGSNVDYAAATTSAQLTLSPGWRTNFWWETVSTTPTGTGVMPSAFTSTPAPAASDVIKRLVLTVANMGETGFFLYNSGAVSTGYTVAGSLLQKVDGMNWWSDYIGKVSDASSPTPTGSLAWKTLGATEPVFLKNNGDPLKEITTLAPMPSGVFVPTSTAPAVGWFNTLKMSFQPSVTALGVSFTINDSLSMLPWLAHYNPAAPALTRTALDKVNAGSAGYNNTPNYNKAVISGSGTTFANFQSSGNNAYIGYSLDNPGPTKAVLFNLPRLETGVLSLGALQHANVHPSSGILNNTASPTGYAASAMPAYAIGNSYVDPRVLSSDLDGFPDWGDSSFGGVYNNTFQRFHFDLSFVLNTALWDKYYFSSVPTSGPPSFPLANPRHSLYDPKNLAASGLASSLQNFDSAANNLLVEGAFNINSTSREAWRAVLASTRKAPVVKQGGSTATVANSQHTPFARAVYPVEDHVDSATAASIAESSSKVYAGFRSLTDAQLDDLAIAIVAQIKARAADSSFGPFRGLADFVNRRPSSSTQAHQFTGPLQAAIDATPSINGGTTTTTGLNTPSTITSVSLRPSVTTQVPGFDSARFISQGAISRSAATPGFLTQADLLQVLGPVLSARSDTFRIRTYGEVVDPLNTSTTTVLSRAWCEAIVQRVPDYVDTTNTPETPPASATLTNQNFGRRFKIVSFRWLSPSDL
ncbi:MAG: hypothetical protein H2172_08470 [Opitutus sp.]|nr:hypothetical protein [Opitutus sp.]MCS6246559.1 hypothetical protein [Opitutus sp.]MCS6272756.1 hypothetical protein [Opitutus sp.]MCS6276388.1 hypothetical protein [Opitutus sp.]MCS6301964.1 hypothetical protein [Opitutus sp.]